MMADLYLPVKPRSDLALLNGIAHILIRDGLIDRDYIDAHTTGFEELVQCVAALHARVCQRNHRPQRRLLIEGGSALRPRASAP